MKPEYCRILSDAEYNVLTKVARKTKMDCWFYLKEHQAKEYYVWDLEEHISYSLVEGVSLLCEGLDCQENFDNCNLTMNEKLVFKNLLTKIDIPLNIDWKIQSKEN